MSKLLERLRHLPDHSMVLFLSFFKDVQGREFLNTAEALPMIAGAANAPVFGIADTYLGHGIVGGFVVSSEEQGKIMGRDALEILAGKPPQDIPIVGGPNLYQFDWRELNRWNLDESRLPAGSTVLFRQPTLWEQYRPTLLIGLLALASLGLLTIYLLFERKQLLAARNEQMRLSGMLINAQEVRNVPGSHPKFMMTSARDWLCCRSDWRLLRKAFPSLQGTKSANAGAHEIRQRAWRRSAYPLTPAAFHDTREAWPRCGSGIVLQRIQRATRPTGYIFPAESAALRVS